MANSVVVEFPGTPRSLVVLLFPTEENNPKIYSVFNSRPSYEFVTSTLPMTSRVNPV